MIEQGTWNGIESVALFGVAAGAMELAFQQKWISKFWKEYLVLYLYLYLYLYRILIQYKIK